MRDKAGKIVTSVHDIEIEDELLTQVKDGDINSKVFKTKKSEKG